MSKKYIPTYYINWHSELILDGNSEHVAHEWKQIGLFGEKIPTRDCSQSYQMP